MELEISPEPDEAERRAIAVALAERPEEDPSPYLSLWRRAAVEEALDSFET